jgi:hypothetical protein
LQERIPLEYYLTVLTDSLTQTNWSLEDVDAIVKPQTQWNPEKKYLNIWVVKFSDETVLGYAQFPSQMGAWH